MNMMDLERTDAFLARNITVSVQGSQEQQQLQQLQDEWGLYAIALIRQCVFDHTDATGPEGKTYQVATMKVGTEGGVLLVVVAVYLAWRGRWCGDLCFVSGEGGC